MLRFPFLATEPVPSPVNLRITEITKNSFRGTWDHGAPDVSLYRITWGPYGRSEKAEVRVITVRFWGQSLRGHILRIRNVNNKWPISCKPSCCA